MNRFQNKKNKVDFGYFEKFKFPEEMILLHGIPSALKSFASTLRMVQLGELSQFTSDSLGLMNPLNETKFCFEKFGDQIEFSVFCGQTQFRQVFEQGHFDRFVNTVFSVAANETPCHNYFDINDSLPTIIISNSEYIDAFDEED